ncbi:hypothetical protein A9Q99_03795 [Gammaproteobacteria bacterium 45_16_T64]|nr:hypothetical protein A9Q99_03795 [Gammaproteobacteria bacterium 45_16_T64]
MMSNFPVGESRFFISGECGQLQVSTMSPVSAPELVEESGVVVIVCHPHSLMGGTMNNKVVHTIARCHRDLGHRVVRFNFRGVEKSEGEYAEGIGEVGDVLAVMAWVKAARPKDRIVLAGFSFGSYVASRALGEALAQGYPVVSLLLVAPAVVNYDFENYTHFEVPMGMIVGGDDEVVEPEAIYRWFESVTSTKEQQIIDGAGHFFHGRLTELKTLVERLAG